MNRKAAPRLLGKAADELPAHERMQLGVLVDRPLDPHEQAALLEARDMLLKIDGHFQAVRLSHQHLQRGREAAAAAVAAL